MSTKQPRLPLTAGKSRKQGGTASARATLESNENDPPTVNTHTAQRERTRTHKTAQYDKQCENGRARAEKRAGVNKRKQGASLIAQQPRVDDRYLNSADVFTGAPRNNPNINFDESPPPRHSTRSSPGPPRRLTPHHDSDGPFTSPLPRHAQQFQRADLQEWRGFEGRNSSPAEADTPSATEKRPHSSIDNKSDDHLSDDSSLSENRKPPVKKARGQRKPKPKQGDYMSDDKKVVKEATALYRVRIATEGAFPTLEQQEEWVDAAWGEACARCRHELKLEEKERKLITNRGSEMRGKVRDYAKPLIELYYGLTDSADIDVIAANREIVETLKRNNGLVYTNPEADEGFYEHPILLAIIKSMWFKGARSEGASYPTAFNPIPFPLLALVFTAVEFCINEWADGTCAFKGHFTETIYGTVYSQHLDAISEWASFAAASTARMAAFQEQLYLLASKKTGVHAEPTEKRSNTSAMAKALAKLGAA